MTTPFSIVVAVDAGWGIGCNNALPWNLPGDMRHFKEVTMGNSDSRPNVVIMGRKTWESIPEKFRPLPGRINCVVTRDAKRSFPQDVVKAMNVNEAVDMMNRSPLKEKAGRVYVIGGGEVFRDAINNPLCQNLYITHIQTTFPCDRFFPSIPPSFKETSRSDTFQDGQIRYFFSVYTRF